MILVALVVLLFLQSWRAAIVPIIAIPVSLIGSLRRRWRCFGFSLNNLSLFGLVLAIGIVVDDAIVVVENVERLMEEEGLTPREAAHETMDEVSGALIAIALVLCGVFVPTAFIPGISGQFYKQFALTIVVGDGDLGVRLADAVAGAGGAAAQAIASDRAQVARGLARLAGRASPTASTTASIGCPIATARLTGAAACASWRWSASSMSVLIAARGLALRRDADRLHPGAGPGLSDRRRSRCRRAPRSQRTDDGHAQARARSRWPMPDAARHRGLRRLRRRHLHQRAQHRRDLRRAEAAGASASSTADEVAVQAAQGATARSPPATSWSSRRRPCAASAPAAAGR